MYAAPHRFKRVLDASSAGIEFNNEEVWIWDGTERRILIRRAAGKRPQEVENQLALSKSIANGRRFSDQAWGRQ